MTQRAEIAWEERGDDVLIMKANGWVRAMAFSQGGWWGVGIFEEPGSPAVLTFRLQREDLQSALERLYRRWETLRDRQGTVA